MLEGKLRQGGAWSPVAFNPWLLSDETSLIQQFFGSLTAVLSDNRKGKRARQKMATYLAAVTPVAGVVRLPLVDIGEAAKVLAEYLAGDQSLQAKHREVGEALKGLSLPVAVLLDDLDRLHPNELVLVFKLVRLIGRLPNLYYLLAFDEQTVVDLLAASDVSGGSPDRAYTFLEKIYQVRLELPPLHISRKSKLVDLALETFLERHSESLTGDDQFRFANAYHSFMASHLNTPRQIKRYVAQAEIYYPFVKGEVDLVDFLLITFLRASLPRLYDLVASSKNELTLTLESVFRRDANPIKERREIWVTKLKETGMPDGARSAAMEFLGLLFLPIKSIVENTHFGDEFYEALAQRRQVGSADYFDRYFHLGVQPDDVSDQLLYAALTEFEDDPGPMVEKLRDIAARRGSVVFEKLVRSRANLSGAQCAGVFHLLATIWDSMADEMFVSTKRRAVLLGAELLLRAQPDRLDLDALMSTSSSLVFTAETLSRVVKFDEGEAPTALPGWISQWQQTFNDRAFDALDRAKTEPLEGQEEWVVPLLFRLKEIASPTRVTQWLQTNLAKESWSVEDLAAALVPVATSYGEGRPKRVLAHADVLESLRALLPIDWIVERLPGLDDAGEPIDRFSMTEDDLTFENRVRHVKAVLRQRRDAGELSHGNESPTGRSR
jgi:hypothetical protein